MRNLKPIITIIICLAVLVTVSFIYQKFQEEPEPISQPVEHQSSADNIFGYAWSDNIDWISFNCCVTKDCDDADSLARCATSDYGTSVSWDTGDFHGWAWSDTIGYIDFDPAGTYPAVPNYSACVDIPDVTGEDCDGIGDYKVAGWARACAIFQDTAACSGALRPAGELGGWDGWIKLGDGVGDNPGIWISEADKQVHINPDTKEFEGWAWGGEVIGWISFNCKGPDMCGI